MLVSDMASLKLLDDDLLALFTVVQKIKASCFDSLIGEYWVIKNPSFQPRKKRLTEVLGKRESDHTTLASRDHWRDYRVK